MYRGEHIFLRGIGCYQAILATLDEAFAKKHNFITWKEIGKVCITVKLEV